MARTPRTEDKPEFETRRTKTHVDMARWSTFWLIVFMLIVGASPFYPFSINGAFTAFVAKWLLLVFAIYIGIQFHETAHRSATNQSGFFADNALAFVAFVIGFAIFILLWAKPEYTLTPDQIYILIQCMVWNLVDFVYGIIISQRIAFAGKEREEEKA